MDTSQEQREAGIFTRTQAFNFLKDLLGVSRKVFISKRFFYLFFESYEAGLWKLKRSEDVVTSICTKTGIKEFNKAYWQKKQEKKTDEAKEIAQHVHTLVLNNLDAVAA